MAKHNDDQSNTSNNTSSTKPKAKNPAAVALGRKGGQATGRKGFAAIDPERRKEIQQSAVAARQEQRRLERERKQQQ